MAVAAIDHHVVWESTNGHTAGSCPVFNPATGEQIGLTPFASPEEVARTVSAAAAAAEGWAETPVSRRAAVMFQVRELLRAHADELAELITTQNGKTLTDARGEVARGLESVEFACGIPHLLEGRHSSNAASGMDVHSIRQPLGVVAGITPFNFPVMVPLWMMANAIACGNAFILKPSEKVPSPPVRLAELLEEAGVPPGVVSVVHGGVETVDALLEHEGIAAVSFVGSTPVARQVYVKGTAAGKRVQALGGAKNHMVVFPDADVANAADAAVAAGYGAAGERCMALALVVAVGDVADDLVEAIRARALEVKVGGGAEPGVDMGPVITREHRDRVASYLDVGPGDGAQVVLDGREADCWDSDGFFIGPSLVDGVKPNTKLYDDEVFGPVLGVVRAESYEEALRLVNENPYGNGTAIFTRDGGTARRFQRECNIGMVGVNVPIPVPVAWSSFGGWKSSLFGDTHMYGPEGVHFFTRQKVVSTRWP